MRLIAFSPGERRLTSAHHAPKPRRGVVRNSPEAGVVRSFRILRGPGDAMKTRQDALDLLHRYTESESLRKHALAVEQAMRAYARRHGGDEEIWGICGLLHDFDYEKYPTAEEHPFVGSRILEAEGWDEGLRRATPRWRKRCSRATSSVAF
jgi:predicted hydrolase (HD superfamily)